MAGDLRQEGNVGPVTAHSLHVAIIKKILLLLNVFKVDVARLILAFFDSGYIKKGFYPLLPCSHLSRFASEKSSPFGLCLNTSIKTSLGIFHPLGLQLGRSEDQDFYLKWYSPSDP